MQRRTCIKILVYVFAKVLNQGWHFVNRRRLMFAPGNMNIGSTVIPSINIKAVQRDAVKVQQRRRPQAKLMFGRYRLIDALDNGIELSEAVRGLSPCNFEPVFEERWRR